MREARRSRGTKTEAIYSRRARFDRRFRRRLTRARTSRSINFSRYRDASQSAAVRARRLASQSTSGREDSRRREEGENWLERVKG